MRMLRASVTGRVSFSQSLSFWSYLSCFRDAAIFTGTAAAPLRPDAA
jgi:hypothetical protein